MTLFHVAPGLLPQTTGPGWGINLETLLTFEKNGGRGSISNNPISRKPWWQTNNLSSRRSRTARCPGLDS